MKNILKFSCLLPFLLGSLSIQAQEEEFERIKKYHSFIEVKENGDLFVTETITVWAEGQQIQRGIYRTFPTRYRGEYGLSTQVDFEVLEVLKDGSHEPYFTESQTNGVALYVGDEGYYLPRGEYTYTLKYRTNKQIGFFDDYDELYWNVTGLDWGFQIDNASATVLLPPSAKIKEYLLSAYSGAAGETTCNCQTRPLAHNQVEFTMNSPLQAYTGLTIAIPFQKEVVYQPSTKEQIFDALGNNPGLILLLVLLAYYLWAWLKVGVDPKKGVITPSFYPPQGISPSSMRYIIKMHHDQVSVTAALVSLAIKGAIRIEEKKGKYSISRVNTELPEIAPEEKLYIDRLLIAKDQIELDNEYHKTFSEASEKVSKWNEKMYKGHFFNLNNGYWWWGVLVLVVGHIGTLALSTNGFKVEYIFGLIWFLPWTAACIFLFSMLLKQINDKKWGGAIFFGLFSLPFFGAEIFVGFFSGILPADASLYLLLAGGIAYVFAQLIKAPTLIGRKVMDQIEGFQMYLSATDAEALVRMNSAPTPSPALFEKYLAYAIALGVENEWSKRFEALINRAIQSGEYTAPSWYIGTRAFTTSALASNLSGSFSNSISSSSSAPGSSSGSGGGGSSGGGGGGGGGGGW